MHYKKRKLHKLHSIPIGLCNKVNHNRLYLVSYSIPLSCMVVLLLTGIFAINPSLSPKTSAVTIQDEWVVKENNSTSDNTESIDDSFGGFGGDEVGLSQEDADAGISLQSVAPTPALAITVSNTGQEINAAQGGNTAYGSYNVGLTGSNVKDYTLSIKANSTNLTMPSGASSSTSTVSGAGGKTGDSMSANTWGYKLTETGTNESSYGTLAYASLPTTLTQIANGTVASPYNLSANKKLVFAAKFGDNAEPGKYTGSITLSLSATPAQTGQLWSNGTPSYITDMQDIDSASDGFCKSSLPVESTITLRDSRDGNSYTIVKLKDGKCWMQENLRLTLTKNTTIQGSTSSGAAFSWTVPNLDAATTQASSATTWTSDNSAVMSRKGSGANGNYYTWCAATAGTCSSATSGGTVASASICPKGWRLPTGGGNGEFYVIFNGLNSSTITILPYSFPTAGYVFSSGALSNTGSSGIYWSATADSGTSAYSLSFYSSGSRPGTYSGIRYYGYPVRCITSY